MEEGEYFGHDHIVFKLNSTLLKLEHLPQEYTISESSNFKLFYFIQFYFHTIISLVVWTRLFILITFTSPKTHMVSTYYPFNALLVMRGLAEYWTTPD